MNTDNISMLKKEVETVFGRKVLSASDCQILMEDIVQFTDQRISLNTLRRIYNLMESKYQPSLATLDILTNYCGFSSYSDFILQNENGPSTNYQEDAVYLNMVLDVFKEIEFTGENETRFTMLVNKLINSLVYSPKLVDRLQRGVAKTENGQKFYFEKFINYDNLSRYYGRGLKYYMKEKTTEEAQLLGNALLCLNSWLTLDRAGVVSYSSKVLTVNPERINSAYLKGRFFSSLLLEANSSNKDIAPILHKAMDGQTLTAGREQHDGHWQDFDMVMAETLVLICRYDEAIFYINEAFKKKHNHPTNGIERKPDPFFAGLLLLKAIANAGLGKKDHAKQIMQKINTQEFYFLSKEFYLILYFSLSWVLQRKKLTESQIHYLVQQTGFKNLHSITQNLVHLCDGEVGKTGQNSPSI